MKPNQQNASPVSISEQALDQLVTGALSGDSYRSLLMALKAQPDRWRDCALAFLREQALEIELKSLAAGDIDWQTSSSAVRTTSSNQRSSQFASSQHACSEQILTELAPSRFTFAGNRVMKTSSMRLALAGALLIGLGVGWFSRNWAEHSSQTQSTSELATGRLVDNLQRPELSLPDPFSKATLVADTPQIQVAEQSETMNGTQSHIDLNSVRFVSDQLVPIDRQMPPELRELERLGHVRIETLDAIMPINLDDGTAALVPVQQYRIKPVVFSF